MPGFYGQNIQRGGAYNIGSPVIRDFKHASKIFLPNAHALAPKFKYLFHVNFELNINVTSNASSSNNYGLDVKTAKLPSYTVQTQELNQYNRKRLIQTKIKYDPVTITFHDDNSNMINNLWISYYNYYYKDGTNFPGLFKGDRGGNAGAGAGTEAAGFNNRNIYDKEAVSTWGYIGEGATGLKKTPFFKQVTIFGLSTANRTFMAYTLINPIISRWSHDTYSYAETTGTMESQMDLQYESVAYNQGKYDGGNPGNILTGFGEISSYDKKNSPITPFGSNTYVPGQGGYVPGSGGYMQQQQQQSVPTINVDGVTTTDASIWR